MVSLFTRLLLSYKLICKFFNDCSFNVGRGGSLRVKLRHFNKFTRRILVLINKCHWIFTYLEHFTEREQEREQEQENIEN